MSAPSWADLETLFHEALACAPADRTAFLTARCAGRPDLQAEVETLLRAHEGASGFWEIPAVVGPTTLKAGTQVGSYELLGELGAGSMGEVYRAHDRKLGRDVAIKVLPKLFASDAERLARFDREARVLAAVNHPNIAVIYGIEDANGAPALVLELIDGETLAERLARPIPVTEALTIARQIADALEAAHEKGVIHRDLKPTNIKITSAGVVKVLDFGLAKVCARDSARSDRSPYLTAGETREGMILGTVAYMSPEQACGQAVDKRTDIWAFGCVLYEMLTSRRAFPGDDVSDTIAGILRGDPDWTALPANTPAAVRKLLRGSLEKDRRERLPDIGVARLEIKETLTAPPNEAGVPLGVPPASGWRRAWALTLFWGLLASAGIAGAAVWLITRPAPPRVVRLTLTASGMDAFGAGLVAISPDGTRLAYVGPGQIVVHTFDQLKPMAVLGVGSVDSIFFSPDGQWIGFSDNVSALRKVAVTGGPPTTVSGISATLRGASWSTDDTIVFAMSDHLDSGLIRVAAAGGKREVLTTPNRAQGEVGHWWPEVLPGGHAVLFTIATGSGADNTQIAVFDLRTRKQKVLIYGGSHARYVPTGHLVYGVAGTLRAVGFDINRLEVVGASVPLLEQVSTTEYGALNMSLSHDGTLVYVAGGVAAAQRTLVWVDRQGREEALKAPPRFYFNPRLSPDGARLAVGSDKNIWIWDIARETMTRLTFDPAGDLYPVWTPNGRRLAFASLRGGPAANLFWQAADGTGPVERLTESPNTQSPHAFSPDGTRLLIREERPTTGADLALLALEGERRVETLVQTTFTERNGEISPDGRWLAYQSDESGRFEIYVRPFPDADRGRWQISTGGGTRPLWARRGKELFYVAPDSTVMRLPVESGSTLRAGLPTKLVEGGYSRIQGPGRNYDVSPDGQRFLMIKDSESNQTATSPSIVVVQHWFEELKRLAPTK